jgi:hypothetical protein
MIVLNTIMLEFDLAGTILGSNSFPQSKTPIEKTPIQKKLRGFTGELDSVVVRCGTGEGSKNTIVDPPMSAHVREYI